MLQTLLALQSFIADRLERENGATAVEYGLMVALIAVIIIGAVQLLGQNVDAAFKAAAAAIN